MVTNGKHMWWTLSNVESCLITVLYTWTYRTLYINCTLIVKKINLETEMHEIQINLGKKNRKN